jgi:hypothetical protein
MNTRCPGPGESWVRRTDRSMAQSEHQQPDGYDVHRSWLAAGVVMEGVTYEAPASN